MALLHFIAALSLTTTAGAGWEYVRAARDSKPARGTLTTSSRHGVPLVSVRQLCYALGCRVLYQWASHRAVIQNPAAGSGALVSSLTSVAVVDGRVVDFKGQVVSDLQEGYLLPIELAEKLATSLRLGRIERRDPPEPPPALPRGSVVRTLVIDPGHGGSDLGTEFGGIHEKDVALIYAFKLRDELRRAMPDVDVLLTRDEDQYVSLPDRAKFANSNAANLFISLHVNHARDPRVEGVETYILSPEATDDDAKKVALLENDSWLRSTQIKEAGDTIRKILVDMEQTRYIQDSALAAALIQQEFVSLDRKRGLKSRGVKQAMFYVLSQVAMPSTLVEMGFLSSTGDRGRLMDVVFRDEFVRCLISGLKRYREKMSVKEVSTQ